MPMAFAALRRICVSAAIMLTVAAMSARAQVAAGSITGVVKDPAGQPVPGVAVTTTDVATSRQRVTITTGDGAYTAAGLPPGRYRIDVELSGFKPIRREGVRLATGEKAR